MNVGQKLGPLKDLKVKRVPFFKGKTTLFGEKGPPFEKNLEFNQLDHQVDTLRFNLSPKFWVWGKN